MFVYLNLFFFCSFDWLIADQAASLSQLVERQKKDTYDLEVSHVKGRFVLQLHNMLSRHDKV